ncbi:pyridoxamine 5'-phosphate oxidase family protein [Desulfatibacillum aliphaticivorans]|uniref:pyridoxamine 5'-phosphate oxidase family protein n=1 Tax=Desulfatibacillum aliphaticivorans TaxID=218208 RepID=UPI0003F63BF2|nr:pyridoxamine 5'-phosphate oxidase family protein [Desulfatibacillum aliphaticivorans]
MESSDFFNEADIAALEPETKIGLLATVNPEGLPHVTLITSLQAGGPKKVMFGQFAQGLSKIHVKSNPRTAFLVLTLDRKIRMGKALWKESKTSGPEFEMFNEKPMFRYNAYFGIHTVHYLDLVEKQGPVGLPLLRLGAAMAATRLTGKSGAASKEKGVLKPWGKKLFNRLDAMKFISWVGEDGFPVIVPVLQCTAPSDSRLVFSPLAYSSQLKSLEKGQNAAVFGLTMKMEDILVRGFFRGYFRKRGMTIGMMDINWVYNSMPPVAGQIYPEPELKPVTEF